MKKLISILLIILFFNIELIAMEKRPYHHLPDGTFRNPEGSPARSNDVKFSYRTFVKEKKKIDITVPKDHVIDKKIVKQNLEKFKDDDYIAWIGHATFLIKLGETTPSYDRETEINGTYDYNHVDENKVLKISKTFIGKQKQLPPIYSALKKDGKRMYKYAREKIEIEIGLRKQGFVEVKSGLVNGDIVVAEGLKKTRPNGKIKPIN